MKDLKRSRDWRLRNRTFLKNILAMSQKSLVNFIGSVVEDTRANAFEWRTTIHRIIARKTGYHKGEGK